MRAPPSRAPLPMALLQIVCQNCGAKYRLPETFSGDRAKCKACGSVIDVAAQRDGGGADAPNTSAAPAKARPAAAKPAGARPAGTRTAAAKAGGASKAAPAKASSSRAGARRRNTDDDGESAPRSRAGSRAGARRSGAGGSGRRSARDAEPAKNNNNMLLFGGLGAVAVIVILVVVLGGGDDPAEKNGDKPDQTASKEANPTGSNDSSSNSGATESTGGGDGSASDPESGDAQSDDSASGDPQSGDEGAGDPTPADDETPAPTEPTEETVEDPFDPRTELEPLEWPAGITAEEREEAEGWVEDLEFGGFAGINAKRKLENNYWIGTFAVLNKLRTLDLGVADQVRYGDELTRHFQERMVAGISVPWKNVNPSETPSNADRDRNGKNIQALFNWANRALSGSEPYLASKDTFQAWVEKRREQRDGD